MSSKNDQYRNPQVPLGYICKSKPDITFKESISIDGINCKFIDFIIDSGILDVPDCTIYDDFIPNSSSEEDEIIEIPVETCPKAVEIIDVEAEKDIPVIVEKEVKCDEPCTSEISLDVEENTEISAAPKPKKITVEKEPLSIENEKNVSEKNIKKHDHISKQNPHRKKSKKDTYKEYDDDCDSDYHSRKSKDKIKDTCNEYDSDSECHRRKSKHKIKDTCNEYDSDTEYHSRKSKYKVKDTCNEYDSDSEYHSRKSKHKVKDTCNEYDSDSDNHSRKSKHKIKDTCNEYDSDSDYHSKKSKHKVKDTCNEYDSDNHSRKSKHKVKDTCNEYDSDSKSHSRTSKHRKKGSESDSKRNDHKRTEGFYIDTNPCTSKDNYRREDFKSDTSSNSRQIKLKREPGYYSNDSDSCSRDVIGRQRTPSPSYLEGADAYERGLADIKQEHLYGQYICYVCNITMNSEATYQSHINGRRHHKAMNAKNVVAVASKSCIIIDPATKCPKPPNGYRRVVLDGPARIQHLLDEQLKLPCPGLNNVTEIHSIVETTYYCGLCDAHCGANSILPHLNGFKHQLNCLKKFKPELYEEWKYIVKYQIERDIAKELKAIERINGRGLVKVERDILEGSDFNPEFAMAACRDINLPSTSQQGTAAELSDNYLCYSIPDPSKSGFYCRLCDSHSNSQQMWQSHIVGKRHLANLKKAPGTAPSKSKYVRAPDIRPYLDSVLRGMEAPFVGLSQIREIRKPEIDAITYNCFLCSSCISSMEIADHLLSRKHREKYLESIQYPDYETLRNCQVSDFSYDSLIEEMCEKVEAERGRGIVEVFYAKHAVSI